MRRTLVLSLVFAGAFAVHALAEENPTGADEARRAQVFATIGSATITVGELEDLVAKRSPYARKRLAEPSALRQLADAQVKNELFYRGAEKLGYGDDPAVQRFVNQTLVKVFVRKEFEEAVTPDDVPDEEVARYYRENAKDFQRPEMRRARHILVGSEAEAREILELLRSEGGKSFRALAKERSLDSETKVRGGDLLYFTADGSVVGREASGAVDATLAKAAFSMKDNGDVSEPLDLGDGKWSVLELTGIRPERIQTLDQASGLIRRKLWRTEREGALEELIAKVRQEAKAEVHAERIEAIVLEQPADAAGQPNP
jgi:parvulin-like peptidyl-prolyl isomerase